MDYLDSFTSGCDFSPPAAFLIKDVSMLLTLTGRKQKGTVQGSVGTGVSGREER